MIHTSRKQHSRTDQTQTKREGRTPRTRHSRFIHMLATCNVYRAHRHGSESPYPGSTPGLNPCNHLAWRACGPWRTHKHNTYNNHPAWLASEERDHLRQTWDDMVWHGMTWGAGAAPKGPDLGEARAERYSQKERYSQNYSHKPHLRSGAPQLANLL